MTIYFLFILLSQIQLKGFDEASQLGPLFGVLVAIITVLATVIIILYKKNNKMTNEINDMIKKHSDEIIKITNDNSEKIKTSTEYYINKLDEIRLQMIEKEDERNKEWRESEKETLLVLNGVNSVLEMSEKMKMNDTNQILEKLKEIKGKLE